MWECWRNTKRIMHLLKLHCWSEKWRATAAVFFTLVVAPKRPVFLEELDERTDWLWLWGKKGKGVPVHNWLSTKPRRRKRNWWIDASFIEVGASWRWVVSFTSRSLYPGEKSPLYPLDRRLGGPQNRSGWRGEGNILDPIGTRIPAPLSSSP
jgi:hypothetical protein